MRNINTLDFLVDGFEESGVEYIELHTVVAWIEEYDDDCTQCWVQGFKDGQSYGSSLALAQDLGGIESDNHQDNVIMEISQKELVRIYQWAYDTGNY